MRMGIPALDLTKCHKVYRHGDITVCMTWFNDGEEIDPCIVLVPTYRMGYGKCIPCVVALSALYKYDDARYLAQRSGEFAKTLDLDNSGGAMKVADVINNYLDELCNMPPRPEIDKYVAADAIVTDENGKEKVFEITDHN